MSVAELVAPHIPFLRRFSRAISGSRSIGDQRVAACLEDIIHRPREDFSGDTSVALFRHYLSRSLDGSPEDSARDALRPSTRHAFLLSALERFSVPQTASILNVAPSDVEAALADAVRHVAGQPGTRVLIVEDEPLIAMDIEGLVEGFGHEVVGVARTRREAVMLARKMDPGLILADMQLADGTSGIDAVADIRETLDLPAIFVTAFPQQLLTGEGSEPTFLINKPFNAESLRAMLGQVLFFRDGACSDVLSPAAALAG